MFDINELVAEHESQSYQLLSKYVNPAFAKVLKIIGFDINFVRGQGAYLYDEADNQYIDCLAGYGTFGVGRNHPVVRETIKRVMDMDLPNLLKMGIPKLSGILAKQLLELAPGDLERVFFCNCGTEGVESALKFARAATGRTRIVHCKKAFHGLTIGSLSVNGNEEFRESFGPLLDNCTAIPFNDLAALEQELAKGDVAGFIVEPIQGKGVTIPDDDYLPGVAELCRKYKTVFIADEVQTGLGRTGKMFALEHWNVEPDILIVAKALSGGYVPAGAVLSKKWIHEKVFSTLDRCVVHSTTFGQNDLAMAAGLATLGVLKDEGIVENAAKVGDRLLNQFSAFVDKYELVHNVRGKGLMFAIEFGAPSSLGLKMGWKALHAMDGGLFPQAVIIPLLADHHILTQVAGHHMDVIKMIPALTLTEQDVDRMTASFDDVIKKCHKFPGPAWEIAKRLSSHAMKRTPKAAAL